MRQLPFTQSYLVILLSKYFQFFFSQIEISIYSFNKHTKSGKPQKLEGDQFFIFKWGCTIRLGESAFSVRERVAF